MTAFRELLRAPTGVGAILPGIDTRSTPGVERRGDTEAATPALLDRLGSLQERLWVEGTRSLLVVLQAMDTGGKDGTISHVFRAMNPQGVEIASFKQPTEEELAHHFLWRIDRRLPVPGEVMIFNRSHYEDVLVVRVHDAGSRRRLGRAVPGDQRMGAEGERIRHDDREVFPAHLLRRATSAPVGTPG